MLLFLDYIIKSKTKYGDMGKYREKIQGCIWHMNPGPLLERMPARQRILFNLKRTPVHKKT